MSGPQIGTPITSLDAWADYHAHGDPYVRARLGRMIDQAERLVGGLQPLLAPAAQPSLRQRIESYPAHRRPGWLDE